MARTIEEDLADYLLGLARGEWTRRYKEECLKLWGELYGENVRLRVENSVKYRWKR